MEYNLKHIYPIVSLRTRPFDRPHGGGLRNHEICQKFIGDHIFSLLLKTIHVCGQMGQGHFFITFILILKGWFELYGST